MILITASVTGLVAQTMPTLSAPVRNGLGLLELMTIAVFSVEYVLRVYAAGANPRFVGVAGRLRYMATPMAVLDLAAILPAYLPAVTADLRFLRIPRLLRLLRLAKLSRYSPALEIIGRVFQRKRVELTVVATAAVLVMTIAATVMYMVESQAQPERFSSIPASMWWTVVTLTTVGYGDVYPVTAMGKVLGGLIAALGIGLFALPTAILGTAFLEEVSGSRPTICPHCGSDLGAPPTAVSRAEPHGGPQ